MLESLNVGRPVLASFSSSIPEVGGNAVTYFDPLSKDDFVRAFERLYSETVSNPDKLKQEAIKAAVQFTPRAFFEPFRQWILS